ncbi:SRPBCC family protein [Carboxylicivirga sediminis]|uniref:SRPBCC family protein n=1 Tax=Carboxylicivirga sediminis TaxID=2006564 RepID=A0A941F0K5_9BACT|nr:SRPBCC family protein [Carboxylicivirga sediminis]MBR8534723.1 SRPBCC family protein [Carboxylicivirga sediminis]
MTTFESEIKKASHPAEKMFNFLSDFDHFGEVIPKDKINNWQSFGDSCRFSIDPVGEVGLRIVDTEAPKMIKYTAEGKTPFNFFLWIQLKEVAEDDTRVKLTIKADMNPMIKMVASKPIKKFLEVLSDAIANHQY